jgi:8-oxo-dGTP diphosphatase
LDDGLERLRGKVGYEGRLATSFLKQPFTVPELRKVYEAIWGAGLHRRDFQRKVLSVDGFLGPTGQLRGGTGGPPAALYRVGKTTRLHPAVLREAVLLKPTRGG